jgi:hypothetical protein
MISATRGIQLLIWLYFWLLIFEGALRKWVFPAWSGPLLVVRDPVILATYLIALAKGIFPFNKFVVVAIVLAVLSFLSSLFVLGHIGVILYGVRTDFLYLPLIFLIPKLFSKKDVVRIGHWVLLLSIPMTVLVTWQFISPSGAWINAAAGGEFDSQLTAAGSHIRPAGVFSFVTGMVSFLSMVAAFLFGSFLERGTAPAWLRTVVIPCLMLALVLSGSRSALASVTIIVGVVLVVCIRKLSRFQRVMAPAILSYLVFLGFCYSPLFRQGLEVHEERIRAGEGIQRGIVGRYFGDLSESIEVSERTPLLGYGLGVGTNAGAALLTGSRAFLLGESEWSRIVGECGPVLGYSYILLRLWICWSLLRAAWKALRRDQSIPLLLLAAAAMDLISGQFGQPTTLGFAVFTAGLALASIDAEPRTKALPTEQKWVQRIRGKSIVSKAILEGNDWLRNHSLAETS